MNAMRIVGIILIILGAVALAQKGFTRQKEVVRFGETSLSVPEKVRIPTWAGYAAIAGGIVLLVFPKKRG